MQQNVVRVALARLAASAVALLLLAVSPALAGDKALIDFIGYSQDGHYFAFEEYGVHDGSGGGYSHIFIVNIATDAWLGGGPISVEATGDDPEAKPLATIRAEALGKAQKQLGALKIDVPVDILSLLGEGIAGADGKSVAFSTPMCCGPGQIQDDTFVLKLTTLPAKSDESSCMDMNPVGYALSLATGGAPPVELHRDGLKLPKSRGCTVDYRIHAVVEPFEGGAGGRMAIISSYPFGFEGPDRRFLAVPMDK